VVGGNTSRLSRQYLKSLAINTAGYPFGPMSECYLAVKLLLSLADDP
jgi:hypothetical protein